MPTKAANMPSQCDPRFTVTASTGLTAETNGAENGFKVTAEDSTVNQDITVSGTWWNSGDSKNHATQIATSSITGKFVNCADQSQSQISVLSSDNMHLKKVTSDSKCDAYEDTTVSAKQQISMEAGNTPNCPDEYVFEPKNWSSNANCGSMTASFTTAITGVTLDTTGAKP